MYITSHHLSNFLKIYSKIPPGFCTLDQWCGRVCTADTTAHQCISNFYKNNKQRNTSYFLNHIIDSIDIIIFMTVIDLVFKSKIINQGLLRGFWFSPCLQRNSSCRLPQFAFKTKLEQNAQHGYDTDMSLCIMRTLQLAYSSLLVIKAAQIAESMGKKYTQSLFINLF